MFGNLSPNEGSPNDLAGVTSDVASVIREYTEPVSEDSDFYSEDKTNVGSVRWKNYFCTIHYALEDS